MAKNQVIAGDYSGYPVAFDIRGNVFIKTGFWGNIKIQINKDSVTSYDVINQDTTKSGTSAVTRGAVGATVLGPVGLLAAAGAKNKTDYQISIQFVDGKRSLIEINKDIYNFLIKKLF